MDFLNCLPPEISLKILSLLDLRDILNCNIICLNWYNLINTDIIWKGLWNIDHPLKECNISEDFPWMLKFPCKWKLYFMSYKKIMNNWEEDRYKRREINGRWINSTAYDGTTLVINNLGLDVYNVGNGNIVHRQKLRYKKYDACMCATNTIYVVAKYQPFVLIYRLVNAKYKVAYMLYIRDRDGELVCTKERKMMDEVSEQSSLFPMGSNLICILSNTLYIYMPHVEKMYVWDMEEMTCLTEINSSISDFLYDKKLVYICVHDKITVYDKHATICFSVSTDWIVYKMHINNHLLVAIREREQEVKISAWNKDTGNLLHEKQMLISPDCLLHPTKDILIYVNNAWALEKKEIFARDINSNTILWKKLIGEYSILGDIHSIVAERFLLFCTYSKHIVDVHDARYGNYLYSLYGVDDDDVFASYDILIYAKNKSVNLVVHIYS